jgi:hypothetical protein
MQLAKGVEDCASRLGLLEREVARTPLILEVVVRIRDQMEAQATRQKHLEALADKLIILFKVVGRALVVDARRSAIVAATLERVAGTADQKVVDLARIRRRRLAREKRVDVCIDDLNAECAVVEANNAVCKAGLEAISAAVSDTLSAHAAPSRLNTQADS